MKCFKIFTRKSFLLTMLVLLLVVAGAAAWLMHPENAETIRRSALVVEVTTWHEVDAGGKAVLYFSEMQGDSALVRVTHHRDSALHRHYSAGCWVNKWPGIPSCFGRLASVDVAEEKVRPRSDADVAQMCREAVELELKALKGQKAELDYYLRSHGVQDNGYQQIAALAGHVRQSYDECLRSKAILDSLGNGVRLGVATRSTYKATYRDESGKRHSVPCRLLTRDERTGAIMLQANDGLTPDGAHALSLLPWRHNGDGAIRVAGFPGLGVKGIESDTVSVRLLPGHSTKYGRHDIPAVLAPDGSAVFTAHGQFLGLTRGKEIVERTLLRKLFEQGGRQ